MKQRKLIINQKNYEGYKELYNTKTKMSDSEYKNNTNALKKGLATPLLGLVVVILTQVFLQGSQLLTTIVVSELSAFVTIEVGIMVKYLIDTNKLKNEKIKKLKKKYPYVDTNIDISELEKSLKDYYSNVNQENDVCFVYYNEEDKNDEEIYLNYSNSQKYENDVCFVCYNEEDKKSENTYSKYHNTHHSREGGVCFENISKIDYENFSNKTESDYKNNNQEQEKNKVKTLIR